jgi:hypothetical protein
MKVKIRKAYIQNQKLDIYIYEDKREEYFMVAIPAIKWSYFIPYDYELQMKKEIRDLIQKTESADMADELVAKIFFWIHEM